MLPSSCAENPVPYPYRLGTSKFSPTVPNGAQKAGCAYMMLTLAPGAT